MWCPECGTLIKKGSSICNNCKFKIKLVVETNRKKKDKKEKNDRKTGRIKKKKIEKKKIENKKIEKKEVRVAEKKKKAEVKTAKKEIRTPKQGKVKKDVEPKTDITEKIDEKIKVQKNIKGASTGVSKDVVLKKEKARGKSGKKVNREEEKRISIKSALPGELNKEKYDDNKTKKTEELQPLPVPDNKKIKRNLIRKIESLYEGLIDSSFQKKN